MRSGLTWESRVRNSLCRNSLAGDDPVVAWGVLLYDSRKLQIRCCREHDGSDAEDSNAYLKVCTKRSAKPLDEGW